MPKKIKAPEKEASWARLYPLQNISLIQLQLFDNTKVSEGVKGQSAWALKLFVHTKQWNIDLQAAEWWRVVQLIDPKTMASWVRRKHADGGMTDEQKELYDAVIENAEQQLNNPDYDLVKVGHIASPPGNIYFVGQFVYLSRQKDCSVNCVIVNGNETRQIPASKWKFTKKRGRVRKAGTPVLSAIDDPSDILGRQEIAATREDEYMKNKPVQVEERPMSTEEALRSFLGQCGFSLVYTGVM